MRLRFAEFSDLTEMQELYVNTIHHVCSKDYDAAQRAVWTASVENTERWRKVLLNQIVIIAEKNNKMVGHGTLDKGNYIDFFYIHKDFQRQALPIRSWRRLSRRRRKWAIPFCPPTSALPPDRSLRKKDLRF